MERKTKVLLGDLETPSLLPSSSLETDASTPSQGSPTPDGPGPREGVTFGAGAGFTEGAERYASLRRHLATFAVFRGT